MKNFQIIVFCFFFCSLYSFGQKTISGIVLDSFTSERLIGATVFHVENSQTTFTNNFGFFSIQLYENKGRELRISYVGYESLVVNVSYDIDTLIVIKLSNKNVLNAVEIKAEAFTRQAPGKVTLNAQQIKQIPALMGEPDILKSLALTPGVSTGTEGTTGIFVRGGTPDQNLILLDEAPLYNVNHLAGFISIFNTNALKKVDFYKSYIPSQYGGRASSVIDISMKDGALNKTQGEVTVGLINQNALIEGPFLNKKGSYMLAGRYSNLGLTRLISPSPKRQPQGQSNQYSFYDLNAKINYNFNFKNQLQFSLYNGKDDFVLNSWNSSGSVPSLFENLSDWGNTAATIKYTNIVNDQLFIRTSVSYTNYFNNQTISDRELDSESKEVLVSRDQQSEASLNDVLGKVRIEYYPRNNLSFVSGIDFIHHSILPISFKTNLTNLNSGDTSLNKMMTATESGVYSDMKWGITSKLDLLAGLRHATYRLQSKTFSYFEPRIGLNYALKSHSSLNFHFTQNNQFVHLLTNNSLGFSNDLWVPATASVPPVNARSIGIGFKQVFKDQGYNFSLEAYSKSLSNLIDYPEGTNFTSFVKESWEEVVEKNGIGRSYGLEAGLNKNTGNLTGWLAYTLSKNDRRFTNISSGNWFPFKYDRRNMLSLVANYKLNDKWSLNGTFVYQDGNAVTLPDAAYFPNSNSNVPVLIYSGRNNSRMPDFHRLDIGANKKISTRREREAILSFGLYNAYNRRNANYLDLINKISPVLNSSTIEVRKYSIFPVLPFVSYSIKF